jgi:pyridoxal 5'-phosphate synthase pdxS subunit
MADPRLIKNIIEAVTIPVMAKCRIGHFVEAQVLEDLKIDFIDESEVLSPADVNNHINKNPFKIPFVCGCRSLGEALRRIHEGAAMIRTKGEAGTGDVAQAVRHARALYDEIRSLHSSNLASFADIENVPLSLVEETYRLQRLPVVTFAAGGIATPADAALLMNLGMDGVFVGSVRTSCKG